MSVASNVVLERPAFPATLAGLAHLRDRPPLVFLFEADLHANMQARINLDIPTSAGIPTAELALDDHVRQYSDPYGI